MRISLILLGVVLVLAIVFAIPVDVTYAKRHATPISCTVVEFVPIAKGQYANTFKLDCEGRTLYRFAFSGEFVLAKVGDELACRVWRQKIQILLIDDGQGTVDQCRRK